MATAYQPMGKDGTGLPVFRPDKTHTGFPVTMSVAQTKTATFPPSGVLSVYVTGTIGIEGFRVSRPGWTGAAEATTFYEANQIHYFSGRPGSTVLLRGGSGGSALTHVWEMTAV